MKLKEMEFEEQVEKIIEGTKYYRKPGTEEGKSVRQKSEAKEMAKFESKGGNLYLSYTALAFRNFIQLFRLVFFSAIRSEIRLPIANFDID
jgi:hypothetical protein